MRIILGIVMLASLGTAIAMFSVQCDSDCQLKRHLVREEMDQKRGWKVLNNINFSPG